MPNGYYILTLTHRDAPLSTIANAILPADNKQEKLGELKAKFGMEELMYLATCNRVAYIFFRKELNTEQFALKALRLLRPDLSTQILEETAASARLLSGTAAIQHALELSASVDSLVVGEREILRQMRESFEQSAAWNLTGDHLRLLMRFTVETAKDIYTNTAIGEGALSVVALAFSAMLQKGIRPEARVLLVGAGQTNTLFGKFLLKNGFQHVTVFNRSLPRAKMLAQLGNWQALGLDQLASYQEGFDALIVCTGATEPVITKSIFEKLLAGSNAEKTVVDLSVPNNVASDVVRDFPVQYIEVESLREIASQNLTAREQARENARQIIAARLPQFRNLWHERQVERMFSQIPSEVRAVKERATQDVFAKKIALLDSPAQALIHEMMDYMEKKCVAIPIKSAKAVMARG
jgi:glutamyl-tRNA reductase